MKSKIEVYIAAEVLSWDVTTSQGEFGNVGGNLLCVCDNSWPGVIFIWGTCLCQGHTSQKLRGMTNFMSWEEDVESWSFSLRRTPGSTNVSIPASENFTPHLSVTCFEEEEGGGKEEEEEEEFKFSLTKHWRI